MPSGGNLIAQHLYLTALFVRRIYDDSMAVHLNGTITVKFVIEYKYIFIVEQVSSYFRHTDQKLKVLILEYCFNDSPAFDPSSFSTAEDCDRRQHHGTITPALSLCDLQSSDRCRDRVKGSQSLWSECIIQRSYTTVVTRLAGRGQGLSVIHDAELKRVLEFAVLKSAGQACREIEPNMRLFDYHFSREHIEEPIISELNAVMHMYVREAKGEVDSSRTRRWRSYTNEARRDFVLLCEFVQLLAIPKGYAEEYPLKIGGKPPETVYPPLSGYLRHLSQSLFSDTPP